MTYSEEWYTHECKAIWAAHGDEIRRLAGWEFYELEHDFLGFLSEYACVRVPETFTVIDLGSYLGVQAVYFQNCESYISVDSSVPAEWVFHQENARHYEMRIQDFIHNVLPTLGLELNKVMAFCSFVPDEEAQQLVAETFPYHRVVYCDRIISEHIPDDDLMEDYDR